MKKGYGGIKLDMARSYDRIEYHIFEHSLLIMGFTNNLVNSGMHCVLELSHSISLSMGSLVRGLSLKELLDKEISCLPIYSLFVVKFYHE